MSRWLSVGVVFLISLNAIARKIPEKLIIRVLKAQNSAEFHRHTEYYPFPFAPTDSIARQYRELLARSSLRLDGMSELEVFRTALTWAGTRWIHHSDNTVPPTVTSREILERALNGERFTCVEYARLLVDALTAYGYPARVVGLSKPDIETRPRAARHVAVEAWSTTLHKWVFLDPQWGAYPCLGEQWLSGWELVSEILNGKLPEIHFVMSDEVSTMYNNKTYERAEYYREFLSAYTGYLDYPYVYDDRITLLMLICQDTLQPPLAFQGMPISGLFYSRQSNKIYGALDQVQITFVYTGEYTSQAGFTKPEYTLNFSTTMPWIKQFRIRLDGQEWLECQSSHYRWNLHRGINTIEVCAVGFNGTVSRSALIKVFWGTHSELPKLSGP